MKNFGIDMTISCELEDFISIVDEFSENTNYGYSVNENDGEIVVNIEVLPYFNLKFYSEDEKIKMNIDTCYYGMGFHILVLDLIEEMKSYFKCDFFVNDDTKYIKNNNLSELSEIFDKWLEHKVSTIDVLDRYSNSNFMDNEDLIPSSEYDYILTYRGLISFSEFEDIKLDIKSLRERIFILPNLVRDIFEEEGYLLYHVWNNLKDLTLVDDFDERVSLTMFMFEKMIENNIKIHLPQKFAREIYKYLGVDGFSASNFMYRKVKYEIGYENYKKILKKLNNFILPIGFFWNDETKTFDSDENSIFINEYFTGNDIDFNEEVVEEILTDKFKISVFKTKNLGSRFFGYEKGDDYNYIPISNQSSIQPENTALKIILSDKIYEIVVYGQHSLDVLKQIVSL